MEQKLMKTIDLSNGLKLEIYDVSRKLAGDRWYIGMIVRIDIPLTHLRSTDRLFSNYSVAEIRDAVGKPFVSKKKESATISTSGKRT